MIFHSVYTTEAVAEFDELLNAWFPPFRCCSAVPLGRSIVPLPFFRSVATVAVAGENGNAENVFPYAGMKRAER